MSYPISENELDAVVDAVRAVKPTSEDDALMLECWLAVFEKLRERLFRQELTSGPAQEFMTGKPHRN